MAISPLHELIISTIADLVAGDRHVAVGAASPLAAAGTLLARHLNDGATRVSLLGSRRHSPFTDGGRELFDCAAQGRIDTFFLSGAQIDGAGNVNLLGVGGAPDNGWPGGPDKRFSGNFGAPFMVYMVPKIILFRLPHSPATLVDRVDYISAAAASDARTWRRGGPKYLITDRCLFAFEDGRFSLSAVHPGQTSRLIEENTGFTFDKFDQITETPPPDPQRRALIQGAVKDELEEIYPGYVNDRGPAGGNC